MASDGPVKADKLPSQVAAVLFDMDNTLVASEAAWFAAANDLWIEAGGNPTNKGILGGTVGDLVREFLIDFPNADPGQVETSLSEKLTYHLTGAVVPMPGAPELLARLGATLPLTIASNSPSKLVKEIIETLGWSDVFVAALGTEDVSASKPAPDLYLTAARACNVRISDCVVIEDSPLGARAGVAAGAFVITVGPAAVDQGHINVDSLLDERIIGWRPEVIR